MNLFACLFGKWQPTPVFLPGESHERRSLVGYSPRVAKSRTQLSDFTFTFTFIIIQFRSVAQSCPTLSNPMNRNTPGLPVHHRLLEFTQTRIHRVGDVIQPSHPLSSPSPSAPNPSQHQSLFQGVSSSHEVAKVLEFQL